MAICPNRLMNFSTTLFFEFARLAKVQRERTRFPLPLVVQGDTTWVSEEKWKHEPLFKQQEYYTVFYNLEEQMELEKRTDLEAVDVDQIDLQKHEVKTCHFEREEGEWKLTEERVRSFSGDDPLDRFLLFYQRSFPMPLSNSKAWQTRCATSRQTPMMISIR